VVVRIVIAGAVIAALFSSSAYAQRNKFDALRECEHRAALQFKRHNPAFRRFMIDRAGVFEDKYADQVGTQFVSSIYHGKATYEAAAGPKPVRFICLSAGYKKGPVFVYTMPE